MLRLTPSPTLEGRRQCILVVTAHFYETDLLERIPAEMRKKLPAFLIGIVMSLSAAPSPAAADIVAFHTS